MKRIALLLLLPVFAAGCEVGGTDLPPLSVTPVPEVDQDLCGAGQFASLVGQAKSVVDRTSLPQGTRVILPGQAVTQDFRQDRLNVVIDGNATVERLYCG